MSSKLPPSFIRSLRDNYGLEEESFADSITNGTPITSIRLNPYKPDNLFPDEESVPWCSSGRYLAERPFFTADPLFHGGCYYVQEASSMFLEQVLKHTANLDSSLKILDLCAAPGGKSTLISSIINKESLLVSNEIIKTRVPILSENLSKWGPSNIFVSNTDPRVYQKLKGYFDVIVVDAPCSGSGMFRKDPGSMNQWSESAVQLCSQRQQRILADIYPALKKNGILIYSTCSFSKQENEEISDWLCETYNLSSIRIPIESDWGIQETISHSTHSYGYRFYPHKVKGEGFFIAAFRKNEEEPSLELKRNNAVKVKPKDLDLIQKWLNPTEELLILPFKEEYFAIYPQHAADLQLLQSVLYLKKTGTRIGKLLKTDLIPDHELATSLIVNPGITRIELSREQALNYLKRNEVRIDTQERGWALMCYQHHALGWAKLLPNRINNYFPKEMRIVNQGIL